jgi:hypothetical protein
VSDEIADVKLRILQCRQMEKQMRSAAARRYALLLRLELEAFLTILQMTQAEPVTTAAPDTPGED